MEVRAVGVFVGFLRRELEDLIDVFCHAVSTVLYTSGQVRSAYLNGREICS